MIECDFTYFEPLPTEYDVVVERKSIYQVKGIGNYYGGLCLYKKGSMFFWGIENYSGIGFKQITKEMYSSIIKNSERDEEI